MFGRHRETATAVVVVVAQITGNRADGTLVSEDIILDVSPPDGQPFRAPAATPRIATEFRTPALGATVRVEFDPEPRCRRPAIALSHRLRANPRLGKP